MKKITSRKWKTAAKGIVLNMGYILLCLIALGPILYALNVSLSGKGSALSGSLSIWPKDLTFENYRAILFDEPFKGRRTLLQSLLVLNAFPQVLSLFALFRVLKITGMLNSHMGLIMIYAGSMCVFAIWNMKGYFDTIPIEIEEASKIDGASDGQMIRRIIMPLARPATIVTCVMVLITVWNEYLFSTTFLLDSSTYSLAGGLYQLQSNDYSRSWPIFSAASILTSIPLILIFFKIQKYMVSGLTAGGVKG